jgi:uncharacterized RDD family membrane protein YckC
MPRATRDRSLGDGVYFAPSEYVGLGPRLVVFLVDSIVIAILLWLLAFVWVNTQGDYTITFALIAAGAVWLYVAPVKRSSFRTLGYHLMGCRLVTLQGEPPSLVMLTFRSLLWMIGPFNSVFDFIWCGVDEDRQTLRDRYSSMCLIKHHAKPIGAGEVHLAYYDAFGYNLVYARVVHPQAKGSESRPDARATERPGAAE